MAPVVTVATATGPADAGGAGEVLGGQLPLLLLIGGFIYGFLFAGIPYQDPTPEMSADYARSSRIASVIYWLGLAAVLAGGVSGIARRVGRRMPPDR